MAQPGEARHIARSKGQLRGRGKAAREGIGLQPLCHLAVGPGISRHPETVEFIHRVCEDKSRPMVVDADGLNAFAGGADQ